MSDDLDQIAREQLALSERPPLGGDAARWGWAAHWIVGGLGIAFLIAFSGPLGLSSYAAWGFAMIAILSSLWLDRVRAMPRHAKLVGWVAVPCVVVAVVAGYLVLGAVDEPGPARATLVFVLVAAPMVAAGVATLALGRRRG
jgi:hypothetical protein